jgi:fused signal recognition particle receptor
VNGTGKTTTLGKLAYHYRNRGLRVVAAAADTFRAAAVEQLKIWTERAGVELVANESGADPAAVVFDALSRAEARGADVVLVDTAGRLETKVNLMQELEKIVRVVGRRIPGAPHEVLLVLDATTGQNALSQARRFRAVAGVTGIVLTKMDGTARGGMVVAIAQTPKPSRKRSFPTPRSRAAAAVGLLATDRAPPAACFLESPIHGATLRGTG